MSWFTNVRDDFEKGMTAGLYDPAKSREKERQQRDLVNAQIKSYQDQTAIEQQQLDVAKNATEVEKRRINEKQIRTLRRSYRAQDAGFLGSGQTSNNDDMDTQLGG